MHNMASIVYKLSRTGTRALSSTRITSFRRTPPPRPAPHPLCPAKYPLSRRAIPLSSRGPDPEPPFNDNDSEKPSFLLAALFTVLTFDYLERIIVCGILLFFTLLYKSKKAVYRMIESDSPEDLDNLCIYLGLPK